MYQKPVDLIEIETACVRLNMLSAITWWELREFTKRKCWEAIPIKDPILSLVDGLFGRNVSSFSNGSTSSTCQVGKRTCTKEHASSRWVVYSRLLLCRAGEKKKTYTGNRIVFETTSIFR
ncbi:hypothetical protein CEXT_48471 [Caerostris extrusa]|uniref:Uncharacterized protein n=1 Tax=Caerostris extrusa TaxID=172846 RepID=A0AAV4N1Q0_CAEEX|nr:hypothetical protein CEXT_48471 [Caerostris extrusa]